MSSSVSRNPCVAYQNGSHFSDTLHDIEVAGYRYVILGICIFGIVCNLLNLCVLLQRRLKESPYTYLTGLAIADMLTLISISPFSIVRGDYIRHEDIFLTLTRLELQFYMPLANYFGQVSIMITLALTIERYLFTTYPLRTQSFCKPLYARIVIALILFVCALISFPRFLSDTIRVVRASPEAFNSSTCSTYPFIIQYSSTNQSHIGQCFCVIGYTRPRFQPYKDQYYYTLFLLNQISPVLILFYLNLKLIRRVQHSNRYTLAELVARENQQARPSSRGTMILPAMRQKRIRDEHRLTKTLVAIVVVFLVCNTFTIVSYPGLVKRLTEKRYPNYRQNGFRVQKLITNIMLLLNYSINFFFYCAFNQKFLDTLKLTFRHRLCSGPFGGYDDTRFDHQRDSLLAHRTICHSGSSSIRTSNILQSKPRHSVSQDDESIRLKSTRSTPQCCLQTSNRTEKLNRSAV